MEEDEVLFQHGSGTRQGHPFSKPFSFLFLVYLFLFGTFLFLIMHKRHFITLFLVFAIAMLGLAVSIPFSDLQTQVWCVPCFLFFKDDMTFQTDPIQPFFNYFRNKTFDIWPGI